MCGICGIADFDSHADDFRHRLPEMVRVLNHRGPDDSGVWVEERAGLGHSRLSIIDLSDGHQPMSNEDGSIRIAYNGEIYNYRELRSELMARGHRFRTRSDTEVIVHLYEEDGVECVRRLRGMFAFAVWDARAGAMFLVRDRLGIKPLYYTMLGDRLVFGSEIKAILAHGEVPREVRPDALSDYLTFLYVPAPKTMFRDIWKLPAGHWLRFGPNGEELREYWDVPAAEPPSGAAREEIERGLVDELAQAVHARLVSDVPLGAFLSGGVDSSAVVAMMARSQGRPPVTASVGFDENRYNELPYAKRVAERYQTEHYEQIVRPDAIEAVKKLTWHYDEPFADYSSIPTFYLCQAARRHVTVALSGDGGDELFGGYRRYRLDMAERRARRAIPRFLQAAMLRPMSRLYPKADWLPRCLRAKVTLQNICDDAPSAYCRSVGFLDDDQKKALLTSDMARELAGYHSDNVIRRHMARAAGGDLDQLLYTDMKTYLADDILTKVDRASMAVSLEVRVPLLDPLFVAFVRRIPAAMKLCRGDGKSILKSAMRPYLNDDILYRPKQGFVPPLREWLRGPLRDMAADTLLSPRAAYADYIRASAVNKIWREHQSGLSDHTPLLWAVLAFELWAQRFVNA